jgi:hypothetical protein
MPDSYSSRIYCYYYCPYITHCLGRRVTHGCEVCSLRRQPRSTLHKILFCSERSFLFESEKIPESIAPERLNGIVRTRTRDRPACSIALQLYTKLLK